MTAEDKTFAKIVTAIAMFLLLSITALAAGCPVYRVYAARKSGEAILAHAQSAREVLVTQAKAEKEAAQLRADAIHIVGEAATQYPQYRQQEFIGAFAEALKDGRISQIIYVPTEANIPITEPGRIAGEMAAAAKK